MNQDNIMWGEGKNEKVALLKSQADLNFDQYQGSWIIFVLRYALVFNILHLTFDHSLT